MVTFSKANAAEFIDEDDELDEEPGETIESAPPLKVGEEREINSTGLKKKLLNRGHGWETPEIGDEVTIHCVGSFVDGTKFVSTKDKDEPLTFKLGDGAPFNFEFDNAQVASRLNHGIVTMTKGETACFTLPAGVSNGAEGTDGVPPKSVIQFEVELISWIRVVDVCKDGGIIKKIIEKGEQTGPPGDLDEVLVKYAIRLLDGTVVAKTPEEGVEFYVKDGHFCQALMKAIKTMKGGEKANLIVQPQYASREVGKDSTSDFSLIPPNSVLNIDLELVSFKPVINITGDLKVLKKILKEGEGSVSANDGATVTIKYTAKLEDGTIVEKKGFDGVEPLQFVTDEEQVISGLDRAATTMKKGEHAIVTIDPEYGLGTAEVKGDLASVPACSTIVYEVEMLDFIREKAPWEMSNQERIEAVDKKKEEGNQLFKNGKYQRARKKYEKAVDYVSEDGPFKENEDTRAKSLRVSCWLNGAACCLKLKDFQGATKFCSKVLDIESCNVKALYRRAQANMETADLHLAGIDIKKALEIDPQNRELKLLQKDLKQLQAESNRREAKFYATIFSRMKKDTSVVTEDTSVATKRLKIEEVSDNKRDGEIKEMELEKAEAADSVGPADAMVVDSR